MDTGHEETDPPPRYEAEPSANPADHALDSLTSDFVGEVATDNIAPSPENIARVADLLVLDSTGQSRPFKDLHSGPNVAKRQLIIFVRHFFCGNCQEYLRTLSSRISTDELLRLDEPAFIAVIGCGRPDLIPMYQRETNCPFPIYADPSRQLYAEMGMTQTLQLGSKPEYMNKSMAAGTARSVVQALKSGNRMLSGGNWKQVGGEFLFESGQVTWCHRMRATRDHVEVEKLREVLGLPKETPKPSSVKKNHRMSLFGPPRRTQTEPTLAVGEESDGARKKTSANGSIEGTKI